MNSKTFKKSFKISSKKTNISPFSEYKVYNEVLHQTRLFPYVNVHNQGKMESLVISFRFRSIEFNKKRSLPFFFAIELLTHQKCVASLSQRNLQT